MADTGSNIGQLAPEIDLLDGNRERWMLSGARGKVVAPFFSRQIPGRDVGAIM